MIYVQQTRRGRWPLMVGVLGLVSCATSAEPTITGSPDAGLGAPEEEPTRIAKTEDETPDASAKKGDAGPTEEPEPLCPSELKPSVPSDSCTPTGEACPKECPSAEKYAYAYKYECTVESGAPAGLKNCYTINPDGAGRFTCCYTNSCVRDARADNECEGGALKARRCPPGEELKGQCVQYPATSSSVWCCP